MNFVAEHLNDLRVSLNVNSNVCMMEKKKKLGTTSDIPLLWVDVSSMMLSYCSDSQ